MSSVQARAGGAVPLLLVGLVFHAVYLASIFDIYFVSPVVRVPRRFSPLDALEGESAGAANAARKPLADRLVLIVGDGLRADKLFGIYPPPPSSSPPPPQLPQSAFTLPEAQPLRADNRTTAAPYLRGLIEAGKASWGVSHTRVPTESRPGHVALIAGMYEDVSAVTRGWKLNPVTFDSLFNQSSHTFSFGSPDILPMFKYGASPPSKVDAFMYDESFEDFTKDAAQLDVWVHDKLRSLLVSTKQDPALEAQLRQGKVVFFLHLLGLDTTGHAYRPHSAEYYRNIQMVDAIVQHVEGLIDRFYDHDGRTAYVFTADHGMSNIGNHGDGDPDNTRTPLIAWGSGVRAAKKYNVARRWAEEEAGDPYFAGWELGPVERKDVDQADVAALMAVLLGVSIPANSAGRLPVEYLEASSEQKARAGFAVAREILEQYQAKHDLRASRSLNFQAFPELPDVETVSHQTAAGRIFWIQRLILSGRFEEALAAEAELADLALRGAKYLQRYDWLMLRTIVVFGYVGWMAYTAQYIFRTNHLAHNSISSSSSVTLPSVFCWVSFLALAARFVVERAPFTYYLYAAFPAFFWSCVLSDLGNLRRMTATALSNSSSSVLVLLAFSALEGMVIGYFRRTAWSVGWLLLGLIWPQVGMPKEFRTRNADLLWMWRAATLGVSGFTVLPVEKGESLPLVSLGGLCFLIGGFAWRRRFLTSRTPSALQLMLTAFSILVTVDSGRRLQLKQGLPLMNQAFGWLLVVAATATSRSPNGKITKLEDRLVGLILAFAPVFVILSISYETLFYFAFSSTLLVWLELESRLGRLSGSSEVKTHPSTNGNAVNVRTPILEQLRLGVFFLFFIHVGFFGTGNVASISSFYLEPVYRLVPVFNPFAMTALLIFKIMIPFLIASSVFTALNRRLQLPSFSLFIAALTMSDVLTLNFFFLVTDEGSWLQIGQSISHFSIASLLLVFTIILHSVGELLLREVHAKQE